uniref:Uncharacterized protein n=1 Tax=Lepeophtheirus salmonis TaxID=72036 RepID=A0A0K2UX04_LEPSM
MIPDLFISIILKNNFKTYLF